MRRIKCDSIGWHVIARGARRLDLFRDEQDGAVFLAMLRYALVATGATLWAFTLMSNHYHLVIYASSDQLTACMLRLNRSYSRYHNRRYGLSGHAFDGPYKAYRQPTPILLLRTIAYVFMNPVAAGMRRQPEDHPWSCVRDYLNLPGSPLRVDPGEVMKRVSNDPAKAWASFHRAMKREAARRRRYAPDTLSRTQVHAQQFEWLLDHARDCADLLEGVDPVEAAVHWAGQCGVTPKAMAAVLEGASPREISRMLGRIADRLRGDPALARRLALP